MLKLTKEQQFALECQKSFKFFVEEALKAKPTSQQLEFIEAVQAAVNKTASKFISVRSGHGTGKSTILSWTALWFGLTRSNAKIPILAPTQAQIIKQLMPEIRKWHRDLFPPFKQSVEIQSQDLKFKNGNEAFAKTANADSPESVAGIHANNLLFLIDEASGIPDVIYEVLQGALTEENFVFIMTSNPTKVNGYFYNSHHKIRDQFQCLHFSSLESENVTNDSFAKMIEADYGLNSDVYRVRVLGEFPQQNAAGLFPLQLIEDAMNRYKDSDTTGVRSMGVDVAGFGDDSTCLAIRKGMRIEALKLFKDLDTQQIASLSGNIASDEHVQTVFIDAIGIGAGVFDTMKRNRGDLRVINAHAGKTALDNDTYFNKRAEMYVDLKKWLQDGGALPPDDLLKEELLAIDYFYTPSGKMQLIQKKLIKEVIGRSPDRADACAFNFYEQVRRSNFPTEAIVMEDTFQWDIN